MRASRLVLFEKYRHDLASADSPISLVLIYLLLSNDERLCLP